MAGETCTHILATLTTWVALPTTNPIRASLAPLPGDARIRLPTIRCLGDTIALGHYSLCSPLGSDLSLTSGDLDVGFPGDTEMAAQYGQALLASLLAPAFETGVAANRPLLRVPHKVRLDSAPRRSSVGALVLSPSPVRRCPPLTMVEDAAGAKLLFYRHLRQPPRYLDCRKWRPLPGGTG